MLIDDDSLTNLYNATILKKAAITEHIETCSNAIEGLEYLKSEFNGKHPQPELIFLDINMPGIDGWEFLEEYHKLPTYQKGEKILIMLSTSLNSDDKFKSKEYDASGYAHKPLTLEKINEIIHTYFPELIG
jgi:CheY-like chemotaxis protein